MSDDNRQNQNEPLGDLVEEEVDETARLEKPVEKTDGSSDSQLHNPQTTPPARHDEQAFGGEIAALESDDDIDEVGEEYGVEYAEGEELDVARKVPVTTVSEPPVEEDDSQE